MDEISLKLYGLRNCQISLIKQLRKKWFAIIEIGVIALYCLLVLATLIVHDIWYAQLHEEYALSKTFKEVDDSGSQEHSIAVRVLFFAELSVLALFFIELILSTIGYGLLYLKHIMPILELLLIIVNVAILYVMNQATTGIDKNAYFGVKIIFSVSLLY